MQRRTAQPTVKAIAFFRKYGKATKLPGEGRLEAQKRCARALAKAEAEAASRGWRVEWEGDPDGILEALGAVLRDEDGHTLNSRWGIVDPTRAQRRIVEAELALETLKGGYY